MDWANGAGYRYDYAFVSADLVDRVQCCQYLHESREEGLSNHAGVLLDLRYGLDTRAADESRQLGAMPTPTSSLSQFSISAGGSSPMR